MRIKAAVLREFNEPFSIEYIDLEEKEGEAMVDIKAVGVCGRDLVAWKGGFRNLKTPLILGHEIFGLYKGKPVAVFPAIVSNSCKGSHSEGLCYSIIGEQTQGGYAEKISVPTWNLIPLSDSGLEKYAAATCGVATIIHALKVAGLDKGSKVLVTGASGGVGIHGIQYLIDKGYQVYAHVRSDEKEEIVKDLGAYPVRSFEFYKGEGKVDGVFEIVGGITINDSMLSLRRGGRLVLIGNINGKDIILSRPAFIVMNEINITGSAAYTREEYEEAIRIISMGKVRPFYKVYKFEDINQAYYDVMHGKVVGRAVLSMG